MRVRLLRLSSWGVALELPSILYLSHDQGLLDVLCEAENIPQEVKGYIEDNSSSLYLPIHNHCDKQKSLARLSLPYTSANGRLQECAEKFHRCAPCSFSRVHSRKASRQYWLSALDHARN